MEPPYPRCPAFSAPIPPAVRDFTCTWLFPLHCEFPESRAHLFLCLCVPSTWHRAWHALDGCKCLLKNGLSFSLRGRQAQFCLIGSWWHQGRWNNGTWETCQLFAKDTHQSPSWPHPFTATGKESGRRDYNLMEGLLHARDPLDAS